MSGFGEELRRAREERGVTLETICDGTKVSAKHIRALEAGELTELPGGVFRRGFVRSYVQFLGLEEGPWLHRFEESCRENGMRTPAEMEWTAFAENVRNSRMAPRRRGRLRGALLALLVLALAASGWCGWRRTTHRRMLPESVVRLRAKLSR